MDIRMPVMDGYQAARTIRGLDRPDAKTVPIIAMTADAFSDDVQKCLDSGMNGHVAKPIVPDRLFEELNRAINK
jgi:CheY-like chemotaxis protein